MSSTRLINTSNFSQILRAKLIKTEEKKLFITNFKNSIQESDLTSPANCNGFGRIRHFRRLETKTWMPDNLPIEPSRKALGLKEQAMMPAQVFQLGACNWRCWYCFVDFSLLSANERHGDWLTTDEIVELYKKEVTRPIIIDLSGGQPDLTPEWVPWMMESLKKFELDNTTYLWSDDNLSSDYFWKFLTKNDHETIAGYKNYGRVGCFKGFDDVSFSFNTLATPDLFNQQFDLMKRFVTFGLDIYGYAIFTTPNRTDLKHKVAIFVDRLQAIHGNFPLRIVPLEIKEYKANINRIKKIPAEVMESQYYVLEAWQTELLKRYTSKDLSKNMANVRIHN